LFSIRINRIYSCDGKAHVKEIPSM